MLIMAVGGIMNLSFEKVLLMQTDSNTAVSEVISTYVYKLGIQRASTACRPPWACSTISST